MLKHSRSQKWIAVLPVILCPLAAGWLLPSPTMAGDRPNVLFIAVDDLRPELGCYGVPVIESPNIDALARRGTTFTRAYCQQAVCNASRASLLTGRRPDTTRVYGNGTHIRLALPDVVALPQHFKEQGYHTQSFGKIYHMGMDDPASWSVPLTRVMGPMYADETAEAAWRDEISRRYTPEAFRGRASRIDPDSGLVLALGGGGGGVRRGPSWEAADVADDVLMDGQTANQAVAALRKIRDKRFFLAVGFFKPHLPFVAPKKYFDLYPLDKLRTAENPDPPEDVPPLALHNSGELRGQYTDTPESGPIPDPKALELVRGYYAATTYVDAMIGRVLDELDRLGLREKTVVVLWGDHGWQLGEHGLWGKATNFEAATRSPLIFSAPGQKHPGAATDALAEFVDIYPTLCELCGLVLPEGLEGTSLVPVMGDPNRPWKQAAFSQYPRRKVMGHSMRTDRYRYTEWAVPGQKPVAVELYDHRTDPQENVNVAGRPENKDVVAKLSGMLRAGWQAALPPD
ncbi:MAG TPA: sulfatase [Thermoguttaceae bacterium]|nr:sulfatase [Thermoguttaceae bacterium]